MRDPTRTDNRELTSVRWVDGRKTLNHDVLVKRPAFLDKVKKTKELEEMVQRRRTGTK